MDRTAVRPHILRLLVLLLLVMSLGPLEHHARAQAQAPSANPLVQPPPPNSDMEGTLREIDLAMVRLPLATVLGAALAFRPKRRGTPTRTPAVVQTQIILSIVGAVIMLVVGTSIARAFGIVGAANLIRYRAKIEDPKGAGVMLCTLAVGLAAGVGLYTLSIFSTAFLVAALSVIESFEPTTGKKFEVSVQIGEKTGEKQPRIEAVLRRYRITFDLRTSSDEKLSYAVNVPLDVDLKYVTDAILALDPKGHGTVEWEEKKKGK